MINPVWLNTFCTLVDVGHFTQTANQLHMTQSGVSQHIKKLEQQLSTPLIIREGKSFSLTTAGKKLYLEGQKLLLSFAKLEHSIKRDNKFEGLIQISSPGSIGLKLYPYLLSLQQQHSKLIFDYSFAPNLSIEDSLIDRNCDIGLLTELTNQENITCQAIAAEPLVLVTPAEVNNVNWTTLMELGFIDHPDGAHHAHLLLSKNFKEFEHIKQFPHKGLSNQINLICMPVSLGLGFTVLPLHAATLFKQQQSINIHYLTTPVVETLYFCINNKSVINERIKFIKSSLIELLG